MKRFSKVVLCAVLLVFVFTGCAKINYVGSGVVNAIGEIKDGSWLNNEQTNTPTLENVIIIDAFVPGVYGGIDFQSEEDVVNYYIECYNNTKAQTAEYIDEDGNTQVFYNLMGEEKLTVDNILVDGQENDMLNKAVPPIVNGAFQSGLYGLPPSNNRNPLIDNTNCDEANPGDYDFRTSHFKPEYCLACNVSENEDGTITMVIQPKDASMSARGGDSQGSFFEVVNDLGETVSFLFENYSMLSWASGNTDENCRVDYTGGTGTITIDPKTNTVVSADYQMNVFVEVKHANVTVIKDKSGAIYITHTIHYPASDEYLMSTKGITRK